MKDLRHIAIIMDGNRRWAVKHGYPKIVGHTYGAKNIRRIADTAARSGATHLTLYALSTENLGKRSEKEMKHLFALLEKLPVELAALRKGGVRFRTIGDLGDLPERTRRSLVALQEDTAGGEGLILTVGINYGGRDEIVRAVNALVKDGGTAVAVDESRFAEYLDTAGMPDVDLLIRTGGHKRLSNFLPWQSTYAELYFTDIKWPAFSEDDLERAIVWFGEQQRNQGK